MRDRVHASDPEAPELLHGPYWNFACTLFLVRHTGAADAWLRAVGACEGVVTSAVETSVFVAPTVILQHCSDTVLYDNPRLSSLPAHAEVRYMSLDDRLRVVYRMLHDRVATSGVSGFPPSLIRMLSGLPPSVLRIRCTSTADDDQTFTSASLMGWYVHIDNVLQWLRHSPEAHEIIARGERPTFKRHSDELMLRALRRMANATANGSASDTYPEAGMWTGSAELKVWALGAFCTFATLFGIPASHHAGWLDLFIMHMNAIAGAGDEPAPENSRDGYGATDVDAEYSEARLRLAFPALWSAERQAYEDMSRRLWELALLMAHTIRCMDNDANESVLGNTRRFPFLSQLSMLLPKVLCDLRVFAPFLAIFHERLAPSLVWGLAIPSVTTAETALCQLLLVQRRRDAAGLLELMREVGAVDVLCMTFRNTPPRGLYTWLNTLPDDWRLQTVCVGLVSGPHGGTSLDSLVALPRGRAALVGLPLLLHALCLSPDGARAHGWLPQNVRWGSALRSLWGWVMSVSLTPTDAAWVGRHVSRFLAHPWLTNAAAPTPVLWPLFCATQRWLACPQGDSRVMADWTRMALQPGAELHLRSTHVVRRVLDQLLNDRTTVECAQAAGMTLNKLADLVQRVRARPRGGLRCSAEESWALAQVLLLQPAVTPAMLQELHASVSWPESWTERRRPVDTHQRLDTSTRLFDATTRSDTQVSRCVFALMGVMHVRSSLVERFPVRHHAEFVVAVGATWLWLERDMRHPSWPWARCREVAARDWESRQWVPYAVHSSDDGRHVLEAWLDREWVVPQSAHDSCLTTELFHDSLTRQCSGRFRRLVGTAVSIPPLSLLGEEEEEDTPPGVAMNTPAPSSRASTHKRAGFRMEPVWSSQTVPALRRKPSDPPPSRVPFAAPSALPFDWDMAGSIEGLLAATESVARSVAAAQASDTPPLPPASASPPHTGPPPSLSGADIEHLLERCETLGWTQPPPPPKPEEETDAEAIRRLLSSHTPIDMIDAHLNDCYQSSASAPLLDELGQLWRDPKAAGRVRELVTQLSAAVYNASYAEVDAS